MNNLEDQVIWCKMHWMNEKTTSSCSVYMNEYFLGLFQTDSWNCYEYLGCFKALLQTTCFLGPILTCSFKVESKYLSNFCSMKQLHAAWLTLHMTQSHGELGQLWNLPQDLLGDQMDPPVLRPQIYLFLKPCRTTLDYSGRRSHVWLTITVGRQFGRLVLTLTNRNNDTPSDHIQFSLNSLLSWTNHV